MKKILQVLKKEPMLTVSVAAAAAALFITPPSMKLLSILTGEHSVHFL